MTAITKNNGSSARNLLFHCKAEEVDKGGEKVSKERDEGSEKEARRER